MRAIFFLACMVAVTLVEGGRGDVPAIADVPDYDETLDFHSFGGKELLNDDDSTKYRDCYDVMTRGMYQKSGLYRVYLNLTETQTVYCEFEDNVPSLVVMKRWYGYPSFKRSFADYTRGFGLPPHGDFWYGLSNMKKLVDHGYHILNMTMVDCSGQVKFVVYNWFDLGPLSQRFKLFIGHYDNRSTLKDDLSYNNMMPFATMDRPDQHGCVHSLHAGWWYNFCTLALPTGQRYYDYCGDRPTKETYICHHDGIFYKDWHGNCYSMPWVRITLTRSY
ncbi:TENN-like protein [Mya arenaria]|uniref:TENN-like protein n=1 Tax=Mya arenaria TaxID=6604 RepID=A0ABY7FN75_MYAAR|nr:fibrinogen-like protein 1 [Mya arenaria]WAR22497.1 TENN-like protein [Mya arenaria]